MTANPVIKPLETAMLEMLSASVARRYGKGQHLVHAAAVNARTLRRLALAQPLDVAGVANPSVELH